MIRKAKREQTLLRLALTGSSGSGKSLSALMLANGIGGKTCVIDTEAGSSNIYADRYDYDVIDIAAPFTTRKYIEAIVEAERAGYNIIIVDSFSHAWAGAGGSLEQHEKQSGNNTFMNWRDVSKDHNKLIEVILQCKAHIIVTMRSKTEYAHEKDERTGKFIPRKIGLKPIQRDGVDYEFGVVLDIDRDGHRAVASKDRTGLFDTFNDILTVDHGRMLKAWLDTGEKPAIAARGAAEAAAAGSNSPPAGRFVEEE